MDWWICCAASVWQPKQTAVTSGPVAKGCCNTSNFEWSAVLALTVRFSIACAMPVPAHIKHTNKSHCFLNLAALSYKYKQTLIQRIMISNDLWLRKFDSILHICRIFLIVSYITDIQT